MKIKNSFLIIFLFLSISLAASDSEYDDSDFESDDYYADVDRNIKRNLFSFAKNDEVHKIQNLLDRYPKYVNAQNERYHNYTALYYAVLNRNYDLVAWLLARGANPNIPTSNGYTPLHLAIYSDYMQIALLLLHNGADIYQWNDDDKTPEYFVKSDQMQNALNQFKEEVGL